MEAELRATRGDGRDHAEAADALFLRPADGDQRSRRSEPSGTASSTRSSASPTPSGGVAAAAVVEAVRDPDLGRRRADRARRRAGACSGGCGAARRREPADWRRSATHEPRGPLRAAGRCLLLVIAALVWRLATPADTNVHSTLEGKPVPAFDAAGRRCRRKPALASADLATRQAAPRQRLRELVRALHHRSEGAAELKARGRRDRRHRRARPARGSRRLPRPQRRSLRADRQRRAEPRCRLRSARPACPKASSSMARASSAISISARSRRPTCR